MNTSLSIVMVSYRAVMGYSVNISAVSVGNEFRPQCVYRFTRGVVVCMVNYH